MSEVNKVVARFLDGTTMKGTTEDFFAKAGRLEAAKQRAEEMIRAELLTPPADEQDLDDEEDEEPSPMAEVMQAWKAHLEDEE